MRKKSFILKKKLKMVEKSKAKETSTVVLGLKIINNFWCVLFIFLIFLNKSILFGVLIENFV